MKNIKIYYEKHRKTIIIVSLILLIILFIMPICTKKRVYIGKNYTDKSMVALYIYTYNDLPPNYITKAEAERRYTSCSNAISNGYSIGGDNFEYKGVITFYTKCENLKEADIYNINSTERGTQRLVFLHNTSQVKVFYSNDHYTTFQYISEFKIQLLSNIFCIIFHIYLIIFFIFYALFMSKETKQKITNFFKYIFAYFKKQSNNQESA